MCKLPVTQITPFVLASEALKEQVARHDQQGKIDAHGLEVLGDMGVSNSEARAVAEDNNGVSRTKTMNSIELFAGAGGLALGVSQAGFRHSGVIEWDRHACETLRENIRRKHKLVRGWPLLETDIRGFDFSEISDDVDLLSAGVPCQPFSIAGKHEGYRDRRNLFPELFRAVRSLRPKAILIENVKGLLRESFATYFEYIVLNLTYPNCRPRPKDTWRDHLKRLEGHQTQGKATDLKYNVVFRLLNSADYGVPQRRERVFVVCLRSDLNVEWSFPEPTHCLDALLSAQFETGEYWERHNIRRNQRRTATPQELKRVKLWRANLIPRVADPWVTVRDAISDLPSPQMREHDQTVPSNHVLIPGARAYVGHTGSPLDLPAKTLKAGDHGVPGGENTLALPNRRVRYFTVRESARLQTFPDDFVFRGSWTESMRQLGNAVPVTIATILARAISMRLIASDLKSLRPRSKKVR